MKELLIKLWRLWRKRHGSVPEPKPEEHTAPVSSAKPISTRGNRKTGHPPIPKINFTSVRSFALIEKVWLWLTISLLLDFAPLFFPFTRIAPISELLLTAGTILLIALLPFIRMEWLWNTYVKLRDAREGLETQVKKSWTLIGLGLLVVIPIIELGMRFMHIGGWWILPVVLVAFIQGIRTTIAEHKKGAARRTVLEQNLALWVEAENRKVFVLNLLPLVLARGATLLLSFGNAVGANDPMTQALVFVLGYALFLILKPIRNNFIVACPRCATWTSIVLREKGFCIGCAGEKFVAVNGPN
jgi:hypothetical protein